MRDYTNEEQIIHEAIISGRKVQDFLWGDLSLVKHDYESKKEEWVSVFQKRVDKISEINPDNPSARVELRKRLLQQAALSIQAISVLDKYLVFDKL